MRERQRDIATERPRVRERERERERDAERVCVFREPLIFKEQLLNLAEGSGVTTQVCVCVRVRV